MIAAAARTGTLHVTVDDYEKAKNWLLEAEVTMPDIFRSMGMRSDQQVLTDLHYYLYSKWASLALDKRKPLTDQDLYEYLTTRVPSDKIQRIIETAEKTGYIKRATYPGEWIPQPKGSFGTV